MAKNAHNAFSGLGRHCINDLLHLAAIFPGTPSWVICKDPELFYHLKELIYTYIAQYSKSKFLKRVATTCNSRNPFEFNEKSNKEYISSHIHVFRRVKVRVEKELYNRYVNSGLLDPEHTIGEKILFILAGIINSLATGEKYILKDQTLLCSKGKSTWVNTIYFYGAPLKAYSIVAAKRPPGWVGGERVRSN